MFLLGRREGEDDAPAPPVKKIPEGFSCETLEGVWHEPSEGNLPMTYDAYERSYEYIITTLRTSGGSSDDEEGLIQDALERVASGCHWEDQLQYSQKMTDLYNAMQVAHDNAVADLLEEESLKG